MIRRKANNRGSYRKFSKTANRVHKKNLQTTGVRGGVRA